MHYLAALFAVHLAAAAPAPGDALTRIEAAPLSRVRQSEVAQRSSRGPYVFNPELSPRQQSHPYNTWLVVDARGAALSHEDFAAVAGDVERARDVALARRQYRTRMSASALAGVGGALLYLTAANQAASGDARAAVGTYWLSAGAFAVGCSFSFSALSAALRPARHRYTLGEADAVIERYNRALAEGD